VAVLEGPLEISDETLNEIVSELQKHKGARWVQLSVGWGTVSDFGAVPVLIFWLNDEQGDDEENVEYILQLSEKIFTARIPEKIPVLGNDSSWIASVKYLSPEVLSGLSPTDAGFRPYPQEDRIAITSGGFGRREPEERERHGSEDKIDPASWASSRRLRRKGFRQGLPDV
jgi:hypothetical protein